MMNCLLKDFDPDKVIDLWWENKTRRPNQKGRVPNVHVEDQSESEQSESNSEAEPFELLREFGICEDVQESDALDN